MSSDSRQNQDRPPSSVSQNGGAGNAALPTSNPQWAGAPYGPPPNQYPMWGHMPPPNPHYWGYQAPYGGMPPPPPPPPAPVLPAARPVIHDLTGDSDRPRGDRREGRGQSRDIDRRGEPRERERGPPSPRRRRSHSPERSRSPYSRRYPAPRSRSPNQLRGRFNNFLDQLDELEQRNRRLERRNEDLTEQNHDLRRQLRECQGRNMVPRNPSRTPLNRLPITGPPSASSTSRPAAPSTQPAPAAGATSRPSTESVSNPIVNLPSGTVEERAKRSLQDRMETQPLVAPNTAVNEPRRPPSPGPSTAPTYGGPGPMEDTPHGSWQGFEVATIADYERIRDAADQGSDAALLYIGYLNATRQRTLVTSRSAGIKELLKDWGRFSKPHEDRRARLHEQHGIKIRVKGKKTLSLAPPGGASEANTTDISMRGISPASATSMDTDVTPGPRAVSEPMPLTGPDPDSAVRTSVDMVIDPVTAQADDSRLSATGRHLATIPPGEWPPGIHANIDGRRTAVTAELLSRSLEPWADDVYACEVAEGLSPAVLDDDPTSAGRHDRFLHTLIRFWAVPDYAMYIYGVMGSPMGDRPIEPFPFEFEDYNLVHVGAWCHDHGIELESETAQHLHQWAVSAYPFLPGALPHGPPTLGQMRAGIAGLDMNTAASHFQYPALHFSQPERDWTTATEDFFTRGHAGLESRSAASFPEPPPLVAKARRPLTGPYSLPHYPQENPRSAPTPEPGPPMTDRVLKEADFEHSDDDTPNPAGM
ncbi:hypothetical protein HWV62_133 [Athelia sp. TMB]|nr:hypothetical protein HWV62_133 [Athelia sp. TMB]